MIIKDILNDVLAQSGFLEVGGFFASEDPDSRQMTAIANRVQIEIRDFYPRWPALVRETSLTLVEGQTRYQMPNDFWQLIPESVWTTNGARQAEWPTPSNRWYMYKFSGFSTGGQLRIRRVGPRTIEVAETFSSNEITFAYLSRNTVESSEGLQKPRFTVDTDRFLLSDSLLTLGIQAHWAETKMMPQAAQWMGNYMRKMNEAISIETDSRIIGSGSRGPSRGAPYYPLWRT